MGPTKTPATEKWLLNEIARAKGEMAKLDKALEPLLAQVKHISRLRAEQERLCKSLEHTLNLVTAGKVQTIERIVKAHREIGDRGTLRTWIKDHLRAISPEAADARVLMDQFCECLQLTFFTPQEREAYFLNTFRPQLHSLRKQGHLERVTVYVVGRNHLVQHPCTKMLHCQPGFCIVLFYTENARK